MRESIFLSIYRVYNKRIYKGKKGAGQKVSAGKSVPLYRYSIIEKGKEKGGTKICSLYIDI